MTAPMLVLGAGDVRALLDIRACIAAVRDALSAHEAGETCGPVSSGFALPAGSFHAKAAALRAHERTFVAVKAYVNLPGNPLHGRPTIQGALVLLDGDAGHPLAVMDSMVVTSIRTAAVAALAATHLALPDAGTITIVGCGEQGESQLRAMSVVRPITRALVLDADADKAARFAVRLTQSLGFPVEATRDLVGAIRASQICVTCTTSQLAIVDRAHLHPGIFIAAVGADNPAKQEMHPQVMAECRVVVDSLSACATGGDLHHAIAAGAMTETDVHGELSAIVSGRVPGRREASEMFIFDSTGTALQDVAAALVVYDRAIAAGSGVSVSMSG
jgi:ornithine cyclodeaminase/alanine dehydrogenase-like protein (mu-crystallin family)